jgi:hypothetical protein
MPKIVQHRRGTTAEVAGITGAAGELFVDTSKVTVVVMDGITQGGVPLATETNLNSLSSSLQSLSSNISTYVNTATTVVTGIVRPDGTSILVTSGVISARLGSSSTAGILRPDGTSILVTSGVISIAAIGVATSAIAGTVRPDGTSILVSSGVISVGNINVANALNTSNSYQVSSLGVGTAASGTAGEIRATNSITSWYSDERLKENVKPIDNALEKVNQLNGVTFNANQVAESFGFTDKSQQVGVIAQQVEKVLPEAVKPAPFDIILYENIEISKSGKNYKTVQYEKIVPLLIEAIKELNTEIKKLKGN